MKKVIATGSAVIFGICLLVLGYSLNNLGTGSRWEEVSFALKTAALIGIVSGLIMYFLRNSIDVRFLIFWP
jgi:hypothetical protein